MSVTIAYTRSGGALRKDLLRGQLLKLRAVPGRADHAAAAVVASGGPLTP